MRNQKEIASFREEEAQETVHILIGTALPGAMWISEVDSCMQRGFNFMMKSKFTSIIKAH